MKPWQTAVALMIGGAVIIGGAIGITKALLRPPPPPDDETSYVRAIQKRLNILSPISLDENMDIHKICAQRAIPECRNVLPRLPVLPPSALANLMVRCEHDPNACYRVGLLYRDGGDGVTRNEKLAWQYLAQACRQENVKSCNDLGDAYRLGQGVEADIVMAAGYYESACKKHDRSGCINLAQLLLTGNGVPKNEARAVELFQYACDSGDAPSCNTARAHHSQKTHEGR